MKKKTIIGTLLISFIVVGFLWPAFQPMTPDYYKRELYVIAIKRYLEKEKKPIEDLNSIEHLHGTFEIANERILPEPTRKRNVVIFNKDYLKKDSRDWILIVLGKDMDSYISGDWVLLKNLEQKRVRNAKKIINNPDGLIYYYLYFRGDREEPNAPHNNSDKN